MEREKTFLFASREGKFLNYLDDALKRIEKGEYGFCIDCGSLIDKERLEGVRDVWATVLLFAFVIGGIYGGMFTATEAAGMGAGGAFIIGPAGL